MRPSMILTLLMTVPKLLYRMISVEDAPLAACTRFSKAHHSRVFRLMEFWTLECDCYLRHASRLMNWPLPPSQILYPASCLHPK